MGNRRRGIPRGSGTPGQFSFRKKKGIPRNEYGEPVRTNATHWVPSKGEQGGQLDTIITAALNKKRRSVGTKGNARVVGKRVNLGSLSDSTLRIRLADFEKKERSPFVLREIGNINRLLDARARKPKK